MRLRPRSLQAQLAVRLAVVILVATALGVGAVVYEGMNAATHWATSSWCDARRRSAKRYGRPGNAASGAAGQTRPGLSLAGRTDIFAVRVEDGRLIASSEPDLAAVIARSSTAGTKPHPLRLEEFGSTSQDYYGLVVSVASAVGSSRHPCCANF